ncbi:MAG: NAD(P)H-binding protein [Haliscomenobacter sp.]
MANTAVVLGATGLVGSALVDELREDGFFTHIRLLVRRRVEVEDAKIEQLVLDFDDEMALEQGIKGASAVFCVVGTTLRKTAGDMEAYRKVDVAIPVAAARACKKWDIPSFLLVTSVGADAGSSNYYLRFKGEAEAAVRAEGIPCTHIFRPSMLLGNRRESRPAEYLGRVLMPIVSFLIPENYKPIRDREVARAMLYYAKNPKEGFFIHHYRDMRAVG